MRIRVAVPEAHVSKPVLDAALESVTRLNEQLLAGNQVPTFDRALRNGLVRWKPEPPGDEHFDSADRVVARKWGDCDDIAPYQAASLRHTGEDPGAYAEVERSGPLRWHAVVRRSDGSRDDPSLQAGMRAGIAPGVFGVAGAVLPMMCPPQGIHGVNGHVGAYLLRPQIALRPHFGEIQARADLPWNWSKGYLQGPVTPTQFSMTALHTAPVAHTALTGAISDACELAAICGAASDEHVDRLCAIADACEGMPYEDLAAVYGHEHADVATQVIGSLFGGLKRLARGAVKFIPGVGPVADAALHAGGQLLHHSPRRPAPAPAPARGMPQPVQPTAAAYDNKQAMPHQIVFNFHP
jgi:hypothetical protein